MEKSSGHSEAIIAEDQNDNKLFLEHIDAAAVMLMRQLRSPMATNLEWVLKLELVHKNCMLVAPCL